MSTGQQKKASSLRRLADALGLSKSHVAEMAKRNGFPRERRNGRTVYDVEAVRAWWTANVQTRKAGLDADESPDLPMDADPHKILEAMIGDERFTNEDRRTLATVARELRQKRADDRKKADLFSAAEVLKLLQEHRDCAAETIRASSRQSADELLAWIAEQFGADLARENYTAPQQVERWLLEKYNALFAAIDERLRAQSKQVEARS